MAKELAIPKLYVYSVLGVVDENETLKKFSVPALSRDIYDEFDLEGISNYAALLFYTDHPEYQKKEMWPLTFKFFGSQNPVELEMNLSYSPCFLSTPKKIVVTKKDETIQPMVEKKSRKPRTKKESVPVLEDNDESVLIEVKDFIAEYHGYLELSQESFVPTKYGASLSSLSEIDDVLTSIKAVSEEDVSLITIKHKGQVFNVQIASEFYHLLNPVEVFDPTVAEEGELPEIPKEKVDDNSN